MSRGSSNSGSGSRSGSGDDTKDTAADEPKAVSTNETSPKAKPADYKPNVIATGESFSVEPIRPADRDDQAWYHAGLTADCPVDVVHCGALTFAKMQQYPDPDTKDAAAWGATIEGIKRPGAYSRLTERELQEALEAVARTGIRVERQDGAIVRATVEPVVMPANSRRGARINYGLEPLAEYAWVQKVKTDEPGTVDDRGNLVRMANLGDKLPDPLHKRSV